MKLANRRGFVVAETPEQECFEYNGFKLVLHRDWKTGTKVFSRKTFSVSEWITGTQVSVSEDPDEAIRLAKELLDNPDLVKQAKISIAKREVSVNTLESFTSSKKSPRRFYHV